MSHLSPQCFWMEFLLSVVVLMSVYVDLFTEGSGGKFSV